MNELHDNNRFETSGTVNAVVNGQYSYIKFWQKFPFKGNETRSRLWTAWFDRLPDGINEGDRVTIAGEIGAKVNTYIKPANLELGTAPEEKRIVEWALNDCSLISHTPKNPAPVTAIDESVPF